MFEIGKEYTLRILVGGKEEEMSGTIERYEFPLIKFADHKIAPIYQTPSGPGQGAAKPNNIIRGQIINTASLNFISAEIKE